ncbi:MAG TPA: LCP family protein [Candidatus Ventrimonas merdavium]|nr:LCP family protein [Candidatus Ventrimonas merdavium]
MKRRQDPGSFSRWLRKNWSRLRRLTIGIVLCGAAVGSWYSMGLYRQRQAVEAMIAGRYEEREGSAAEAAAPEPSDEDFQFNDTVTWQGKTYRKNHYIKAVLCIGVDRSGSMLEPTLSGDGGQADGVFLLAQDTARNSLKILLIPRDSMTEITQTDTSWTDDNGKVLGKITDHLSLAYSYGDGMETSCQYTAEAVSHLLAGLPIDAYMSADTDVIAVLNDMVGGVSVMIPTMGMEKIDPSFVLGETVRLQGEQAEAFVRFRDITIDNSAITRMEQQKAYIRGFFQSVKETSRSNSRIVEELFEAVQDHMITDMAKDEYLKIAVDMLEGEGLMSGSFRMVPGTGTATETYDEFYVDKEALIPVLLDLFYREVP